MGCCFYFILHTNYINCQKETIMNYKDYILNDYVIKKYVIVTSDVIEECSKLQQRLDEISIEYIQAWIMFLMHDDIFTDYENLPCMERLHQYQSELHPILNQLFDKIKQLTNNNAQEFRVSCFRLMEDLGIISLISNPADLLIRYKILSVEMYNSIQSLGTPSLVSSLEDFLKKHTIIKIESYNASQHYRIQDFWAIYRNYFEEYAKDLLNEP